MDNVRDPFTPAETAQAFLDADDEMRAQAEQRRANFDERETRYLSDEFIVPVRFWPKDAQERYYRRQRMEQEQQED